MRNRLAGGLLSAVLGLLAGVAGAETCARGTFEGSDYIACRVPAGADLRMMWAGERGAYGSLAAAEAALAAQGEHFVFAMNAGMYQADLSPLGLYIEGGKRLAPLNTRTGRGNFYKKPNGVFCIGASRFRIVTTQAYAAKRPSCEGATQSGPILLQDGAVNPILDPKSTSYYIRNGVGVSKDGSEAIFVITRRVVNFDTFARLFRDALGMDDALFLDGSISVIYAPEVGAGGFGFQSIGPIVGLVAPGAAE